MKSTIKQTHKTQKAWSEQQSVKDPEASYNVTWRTVFKYRLDIEQTYKTKPHAFHDQKM